MPALAYFDSAWWAIWSSNDKKTPSAEETLGTGGLEKEGDIPVGHVMSPDYANIEGVSYQRVVLSKSEVSVDTEQNRLNAFRSGWTTPDPNHLNGLFAAELADNPDNRQWAPDLLVVDVDRPGIGETQELWAFFTQNRGRDKGSYWARLPHSRDVTAPDVPEWDVQKLSHTDLGVSEDEGFAFISANAIQLKHQPNMAHNGRILVPIMPENQNPDNEVENDGAVLYTDDGGLTWQVSNRVTPPPAYVIWEPVFAESPTTGHLHLYYKNREPGRLPSSEMLLYSRSTDRGQTWSAIEAMPLEVPGIGGHAFSFGNRVALINQDFENGRAGESGARDGDRTGRVTDSGPTSGFQNNDKINMALFFSRSGERGTFLPGPTVSTNQLSDPAQLNQRGSDLAHMTIMDDRLFMIHRSSRSIRGAIVHSLPKDDKFYLYPRTAVDIQRDDGELDDNSDPTLNWAVCENDARLGTTPEGEAKKEELKQNRASWFDSAYCTYRVTFPDDTATTALLPRLERQASISIETEQADFAADEMLELQFDFTSRIRSSLSGSKRRIALLTIGGPDDYGYIELGNPLFPAKVLFYYNETETILGDYQSDHDDWGQIDVKLHGEGLTITLEGNPAQDICIPGGVRWQKLFFGYGYTQGKSYLEHVFNPLGWFRFRTAHVKSRIADASGFVTSCSP